MTLKLFAGIAIILTIISACGPSQPELAVKKIAVAEELLAKGDTTNALLNLDSIPKLFPEALTEARSGLQISNRIYSSKLVKQRENLAAAKIVIDSLINEFNPEKGEFEKYTNYIHNRLGVDKNWSRSFLQVILNEKGDLSLMSNYRGGQWINHTSVSVEGDGVAAKTDSVSLDHVNNHQSEFNGSKWEKVTYQGPQADQVIALIAANVDKKLKSKFVGKPTYAILLEESDKKAIKSTYELSKAFKVKVASEKLISYLEKKIKPEDK